MTTNIHTEEFISYLYHRLKSELPGRRAQKLMVPEGGEQIMRRFTPTPTARPSAVLLPLVIKNNNIEVLFTLRSSTLSNHSGQISFPGGRAENGETPTETALREVEEEIGIGKEDIQILGSLSDLFVPPSDSIISPLIGIIRNLPLMIINADEVEEVFLVPLADFLDPDKYKSVTRDIQGYAVQVPTWSVHPTTPLWGATAMILSELVELYREFLDRDRILS